ncbi:MAG: hypothetical protein JWN72_1904 [Thermoleophilia bacterium]|nr:hypothetical protein [Thermoleophilia bacterium]
MSEPWSANVRLAAGNCAWTLLGSVGMSSSHARSSVSVSPEDALLIASIGAEIDVRLRHEARDWYATFHDLIAHPVVNRRLASAGTMLNAAWSSFAAVDVRTNKSRRVIDRSTPYAHLRYRAAFGTQARADSLFMLAMHTDHESRGWTADAVRRSTGFEKGAVRIALHRCVEAGILRVTRLGNTDWFAIADETALHDLLGPGRTAPIDTANVAFAFDATLAAAHALEADGGPGGMLEARAKLDEQAQALADLRFNMPLPSTDLVAFRGELESELLRLLERLADPMRPMWPW